MRVMLTTIVLNEAEMLPALIAQHIHWPGLVQWSIVEGAAEIYARTHPNAVTYDGLSVDSTSDICYAAQRQYPDKITYIRAGLTTVDEHNEPGKQKARLRNIGLVPLRGYVADIIVQLDADEFVSFADQQRINDLAEAYPDYDVWRLRHRHLWHPPMSRGSVTSHEVVGGVWSVPVHRVWKWDHDAVWVRHDYLRLPGAGATARGARVFRGDRGRNDPVIVHLGWARDPQHRQRTNSYYVARGEALSKSSDGVDRRMYVQCRGAWESWEPGKNLPHGARVVPYDGPVPEVWA